MRIQKALVLSWMALLELVQLKNNKKILSTFSVFYLYKIACTLSYN
jgi:hypothetical protein